MSFTDIVNTTGAKIIQYPVPVVLLGAEGGARPTVADASNTIIPTRIVRSAGGARLDYADLEIPISENLVDREQPADFARVIDVRLSLTGDTWPTPSGPCQHFGDYVVESEQVTSGAEVLTGQSQLRPYHFGSTLRGMLVWNQLTEENDWIDCEILFNPAVDGKVLGNRSDKQRSEDLTSFLWAHPETSLTTLGETWQTQTLSEWSLSTAIQSLCHACNENETLILNPGTSDLAVLSGGPAVKDIRLEPGQYLPHYLDKILLPLGFNWFLKYLPDEEEGDEGKTKPQITFFKRFEGTEKQVYMQMPGAVLDLEESNVNQYSVTRSIADSINEVEVFGSLIQREITLPLYPMWEAEEDSISLTELDKTVATSEFHDGKQLVWRAFAANEAGDLTGLRTDDLEAGDPPNLTTVFPVWIPHRRSIEEPVSLYGTDTRIPYYLEYSVNGGSSWDLCPDSFGAKLMPDQIGVLFDGDQPPQELYNAGQDARVRITGTVAGDSVLRGFAPRQEYAVNGRNCRLVLNLPGKFQDRRVQRTGDFASQIPSSVGDEQNDTDAIQDYAEEIRDRNNGAEVDAEISLPGFHVGEDGYEIGDLITAIEGRNVSLNAASAADPNPRYPQITEIRLEVTDKGPRTVLVLDRGN